MGQVDEKTALTAARKLSAQTAAALDMGRTDDPSGTTTPKTRKNLPSENDCSPRAWQVHLRHLVELPPREQLELQREVWLKARAEKQFAPIEVAQDIRQNLIAVEKQLAMVDQRDELQAGRPDGCWCLGTGGPRGWGLTFEPYCPCPDGDRLRAETQAEDEAHQQERWAEPRIMGLVDRLQLPPWITDQNLSLTTFRPVPSQRVVYEKLLAAAEGEPHSIILYGPRSTGKTGLLATLLREWVTRTARPGKYWASIKLLKEITRQSHQEIGDEGDVLYSVGRIPYLLIDDIDKLSLNTPFSRETLFQLVNERYDAGLVTMVTTNLDMKQLMGKLDGYVTDRLIGLCGGMESGWVIRMPGNADGPDNRRTAPSPFVEVL